MNKIRTIRKQVLDENTLFFSSGNTVCYCSFKNEERYTYTNNGVMGGAYKRNHTKDYIYRMYIPSQDKPYKTNRRAIQIKELGKRTINDNSWPATYPVSLFSEIVCADGGTRTHSLNGIFNLLRNKELLPSNKDYGFLAFGVKDQKITVDMDYLADSITECDVPFGFSFLNQKPQELIYLQTDGYINPSILEKGLLSSSSILYENRIGSFT